MNIATMIRQLAGDSGKGMGFAVGTVTAVDKTARTVDVQPLNEDAPLLGVNLQANQESAVGVVQIPRKDSFVMVGYVADGIFKSQDEIDNHATQEGAALGRIRWKDLNNDGKITEADQEWIYDPTPDFTYGFNIYLEYKNFDFTAFFQGVQGVDIISDLKKETDIWAGLNIGFLNKGRRLLDAWSATNPNSNIPAVSLSDNNNEKRVSSYWVENGSYLKLRTVQIGYNVPKSFAQKLAMERLRFYLSAQNLFTVKSSSFTGVDPENPNYGYPIPLNITFGLNVTF